MPYDSLEDLPERVKHVLPKHALHIYFNAFNHAWNEYSDPRKRDDPHSSQEEVAHRVAWAAVKHIYEKDEDGIWVLKEGKKYKD